MKIKGDGSSFTEAITQMAKAMALGAFDQSHESTVRAIVTSSLTVGDARDGKQKPYRFTLICEPQVFEKTVFPPDLMDGKGHTSVSRLLMNMEELKDPQG